MDIVSAVAGSFAEALAAARLGQGLDGAELARRVNAAAEDDIGLGEGEWTRSRPHQVERSPLPIMEGTVRRFAAGLDRDVYLVFVPRGTTRFVCEVTPPPPGVQRQTRTTAENAEPIRARLQAAIDAGASQARLAVLAGLDQAHISRFRRGKTGLSKESLEKVTAALVALDASEAT